MPLPVRARRLAAKARMAKAKAKASRARVKSSAGSAGDTGTRLRIAVRRFTAASQTARAAKAPVKNIRKAKLRTERARAAAGATARLTRSELVLGR
eukprot:2899445-Pyramimonas_sp.AAC.1